VKQGARVQIIPVSFEDILHTHTIYYFHKGKEVVREVDVESMPSRELKEILHKMLINNGDILQTIVRFNDNLHTKYPEARLNASLVFHPSERNIDQWFKIHIIKTYTQDLYNGC
jgi:hypothetical protein